MNREIKIRGFSEELKKWVYGDLVNDMNTKYIIPIESSIWRNYLLNKNESYDTQIKAIAYKVVSESIGQFIEENDINELRIYEGDIAEFTDRNGKKQNGVIKYVKCCFVLESEGMGHDIEHYVLNYGLSVIGNIYENPELIK